MISKRNVDPAKKQIIDAKNKHQCWAQVNKLWLKAKINAENKHINHYCKATLIPGTR